MPWPKLSVCSSFSAETVSVVWKELEAASQLWEENLAMPLQVFQQSLTLSV